MPAETNDRIKALASLLNATDNYDDGDMAWSGIVSNKLKLFEKTNSDDNSAVAHCAIANTGNAADNSTVSKKLRPFEEENVATAIAASDVEDADDKWTTEISAINKSVSGSKPKQRDGEKRMEETAASKDGTTKEKVACNPPVICRGEDHDHLCRPLLRSQEAKTFLCLVSRGCHDRRQSTNQSRALGWLASRGVPHVILDGMDPQLRDLRETLFEISGVRGNYPQFFIASSDGRDIEYFGDFDGLEMLNETSGLPSEVLAMHPELKTWEDITFSHPASSNLAIGDRIDAVVTENAPAKTEVIASFDDGPEAMTAAKSIISTKTVTTTATNAATARAFPSKSSSALHLHQNHDGGRDEEKQPPEEGDVWEHTASARGNEPDDVGDGEGEDGSHDCGDDNAQKKLPPLPQSRLTFGCPDTFGAAGTGNVEVDYIPPVKERALAISIWEINKSKEERCNNLKGHQRALEWHEMSVSSSSSDADDGSSGGVDSVSSASGKELSQKHGAIGECANIDGDVKVYEKKNDRPPSFLTHFVESLNEEKGDDDKENGEPEDKGKGMRKLGSKKDVVKPVRSKPSPNFLAQFEHQENNGVATRAFPPQSPSPRRRQALSPRNVKDSFFGNNVATTSSPSSGSSRKVRGLSGNEAWNKPPMSPRIFSASPASLTPNVTPITSNERGGRIKSSSHGVNSVKTPRRDNLQEDGVVTPQGKAGVVQPTFCSQSSTYFKQDNMVEDEVSMLSSLSPMRTKNQGAIMPLSFNLNPAEGEREEDDMESFNSNDFCHDFDEEEVKVIMDNEKDEKGMNKRGLGDKQEAALETDIVEEAMSFLNMNTLGYQDDSNVKEDENRYYRIDDTKKTMYDENDDKNEDDLLVAAAQVALSLNRFLTSSQWSSITSPSNIVSYAKKKTVNDGMSKMSMPMTIDSQDPQLKVFANDWNSFQKSAIDKGEWKNLIMSPSKNEIQFSKSSANTVRRSIEEEDSLQVMGTKKQSPAVPCNNAMSSSIQPSLSIPSFFATSAAVDDVVQQKPKIKICIQGAPKLDFTKPEEMFFVSSQPSPKYADDTGLFNNSSTKKKNKKIRMKPNPRGFNIHARALVSTHKVTEKYDVHSSPRGELSTASTATTGIAQSTGRKEMIENAIAHVLPPPSQSSVYSATAAAKHHGHDTNRDVRDDYSEGDNASFSCGANASFICAKKENKLLRSIKKTRTFLGMAKKKEAFESWERDAVVLGSFDEKN
ncbi:hypothetical protein ACHAXA_006534 [Cyclostephanos tholiformis]|uniref:Uncharacterized protein n=1 Tax=Cyclostephanos tholiformis TaxID=382380 RepID=A0ABD3RD69_9STRA